MIGTYQKLSVQERLQLTFEAQEFLYREAELLDARRLDDWLGLLAEDIHYWMPIRRTTQAKDVHLEFTKLGGMAFFDDDLTTLTLRVKRLSVGRAWAEDPPSRTRHLISNVRISDVDDDEITVMCNFQLYRTRLNSEEDSWIGRREDVLRRVDGELKLAKRHIYLEQTVILSQNLSSIF
ncbi:MAG: 3-phenylpropionate/cinnamic acid dioxygenase subunit beta [Pseudomonadales bacterium]|nr:3-phenylpropionate/cinnamic acid dioxygenase subunit beta [Pseudomonadales bacterium]